MGLHRLPARIAAVMIGTILVFILTVGASNSWLSQALDSQARDQTVAQVRNARDNLLSQVRLTLLDYAKWEAAVSAIDAGDMDWVYENIGAGANVGQVFQLAVIWGGGLVRDVGWSDETLENGRTGLLDSGSIALIERRLQEVALDSFDATEFFSWRQGQVYAMSAARLEILEGVPTVEEEAEGTSGGAERLLMARRVTDEAVAAIAESFVLTGLEVVRDEPEGRPSVPLLGGDDQPIGYLAWDMPQPGTTMLRRMAPPLLLIVLLTAGLAALGMALVRRSAQRLVLAEHRASAAARTDDMTGLPNRAAFNEALAVPAGTGTRAILFLDVNDFKRINDSIGHAAGDLVIAEVARRLAGLAARGCLLARLAGDEFVFIATGADVGARITRLAEDVADVLALPFSVLGHHLRLSMAMGYAVQTDPAMTGDDLVRQADLAMYEAKRRACREPVAFSALIAEASTEALAIEKGLRAALALPHELSIAYQPIVGPEGHLDRAEALARWTSPDLGPVPPDRFIAVAEQAGLIVELGRKLFRIICDDLRDHPDLRVSVNISPLQLMAPDFIPSLIADLDARGLDPGRIEIELTERVIVDDLRLAAERLEELHGAGFTTALDDFGTGFSSMGYLGQLRFDTLKIDRSFVSRVHGSAKDAAVVDGMITMAHGLSLRVVCEGIETVEDLDLLRSLGCDLVQGYHLGRPMPIAALVRRWLAPAQQAAVA